MDTDEKEDAHEPAVQARGGTTPQQSTHRFGDGKYRPVHGRIQETGV